LDRADGVLDPLNTLEGDASGGRMCRHGHQNRVIDGQSLQEPVQFYGWLTPECRVHTNRRVGHADLPEGSSPAVSACSCAIGVVASASVCNNCLHVGPVDI